MQGSQPNPSLSPSSRISSQARLAAGQPRGFMARDQANYSNNPSFFKADQRNSSNNNFGMSMQLKRLIYILEVNQ